MFKNVFIALIQVKSVPTTLPAHYICIYFYGSNND